MTFISRSLFAWTIVLAFLLFANISQAQNIVQIGGIDEGIKGSGKVKTETRELPAFDTIAVDSPIDLTITRGARQPIQVRGDDNLLPLIKTDVHDHRLYVSTTGNLSTRLGLTIEIRLPELRELKSTSSSDIRLLNIKQRKLHLEISGAGDVVADGEVKDLRVINSGASDLKLAKLNCENIKITTTGQGDAEVWAAGSLDVIIRGSGNVVYHGHPRIQQSISGMGDLEPID